MRRLGDMPLPGGIQWIDRDQWCGVSQEVATTLGGRTVVFASALSGGRPVTLEAGENHGWFSPAQRQQLLSMAAIPGAVYTLTWDDETLSVVFRHHDPPAVDLSPLFPDGEENPAIYHIGLIRLMSVSG